MKSRARRTARRTWSTAALAFFCKVPSRYVFHVLNLDALKEELLTTVTGSSSTEIKWEAIKHIPVPSPPSNDFDTFLEDMAELESKIGEFEAIFACGKSRRDERK